MRSVRRDLTANRYTYVNGDPVNAWDPSGHCTEALSDEEYLQCVYILQFNDKTDDLEGTPEGEDYYRDQVGDVDTGGIFGGFFDSLSDALLGENEWVEVPVDDADYVAQRRDCTGFARGAGAGTSAGLNPSYTTDLKSCLGDLSFYPGDWAYDAENDRYVIVTGTEDRCGDCGPQQGKHVSVTYRLNPDNSATRVSEYVDKPGPGWKDYTGDFLRTVSLQNIYGCISAGGPASQAGFGAGLFLSPFVGPYAPVAGRVAGGAGGCAYGWLTDLTHP